MLNVKRHIPKNGIDKLVKNIMIVEKPSAFEVTFFPVGYPFINVVTSSEICLKKNGKTLKTNSYICGQAMSNFDMILPDIERFLVIEFHPYSLQKIFKCLTIDLFDQQVPLKLVDKDLAAQLHDLMSSSFSSEKVIDLVQDILISRFSEQVLDERVLFTLNLMMNTHGETKIKTLANTVNLTNRRLEQLFSKNIGISAKKYSRIIRFNNTLYEFFKECNDKLHVSNSYFDQAHFIHEINRMSGMSPTKLSKHLSDEINRFSAMGSNLFVRYPINPLKRNVS